MAKRQFGYLKQVSVSLFSRPVMIILFFVGALGNSTSPQPPAIELYGTIHSMGIIITLDSADDPDSTAVATVTYRESGGTNQVGFPLTRVNNTRFAGSLFWLEPNSSYDVEVTFSDSDGDPLDGQMVAATAATRAETTTPPANNSYYVSPAGTSTTCTPTTPCSLTQGIDQAQAGDEVILLGGTYYQGDFTLPRSGTEGAPISLRGETGQTAILDGSDPAGFTWTNQGNGIYQTTLNIADTHLVTANGQRLYPYQTFSDLQSLSWGLPGFYVNGTTLSVRLTGDVNPAGANIVISRFNRGFYISQDYIHITNLTFRHYGQGSYPQAIYLDGASHVLIQNSTFAINDRSISLKRAAHRNIIQDNEFYDTIFMWPWDAVKAGSQLETGGVFVYSPMTGRGNIIRRNTFHDYFDGFSTCPTDNGTETNEMDIYDNLTYNASDDGLSADGACSNVRIWNNTFHDILVGISLAPAEEGPTYAIRNLIYRTGAGNSIYSGYPFKFNVGGSAQTGPVYLFHNTSDAALPDNNGFYIKSPGQWDPIYARNNIWVGTDYALNNQNTSQPLDMDYNNLWNNSGNLIRWGSTIYPTLADYQTGTGHEPNGLSEDPHFGDPANGNYRLSGTSPLIDQALILPGINTNYADAAPDIGAFEWELPPNLLPRIYLPIVMNNSLFPLQIE